MPVVSVVLYTGENWTGEVQMTTIFEEYSQKEEKQHFSSKNRVKAGLYAWKPELLIGAE